MVQGRLPGAPAQTQGEAASVQRQLLDAAQRAAIAALPLPGGLLLAIWTLGVWAWVGSPPAAWHWAWGVLTPVLAAALGLLSSRAQSRLSGRSAGRTSGRPTGGNQDGAAGGASDVTPGASPGPTQKPRPRWPQGLVSLRPAHWQGLLVAAAVCLAVLVASADLVSLPALVALTWLWALTTAVALAPWRRGAFTVVWLPVVTGGMAAWGTGQYLMWLGAALIASLSVVVLTLLRHRLWHHNQRRRLVLEARTRLLQTERDAALRADQDKSRFVAIASHDLRQPVHALGLFAATLQKRLVNTPDEALARNFLRAVDDLEHSFSSMLDMSRLDGGGATPLMHTFPLRDLFRRLHMQHAGHAELQGLGLRFSTGGKSVTSDPQLLERILGNLIQNAMKFTTQGGVVVVARSTAPHINIEVWDTGLGMGPEQLPKVFQEFYQIAASRSGRRDRSQGLGMGLAIVKRLTELLGHQLEVASRAGRGTMFRVGIAIGELPGIQDVMAPADTVPMQAQTPQMVLIVEDEEPIREGLRLLLREWGYQTITAATAAEAEQAVIALEGRVDLVLSDLQLGRSEPSGTGLPGLDGIAVIDNVRRLCGYPVPAVIVTGDTSAPAARALAARGDPVLFKPVQPRRLFDAMRAALG